MRWKLFFTSEWPKNQLVQLWIDLQLSVNGESVNICLGMYMLRVQADKQKQFVLCVCVYVCVCARIWILTVACSRPLLFMARNLLL